MSTGERKLALLCAPAGWGKTTLLSEWIASPEEARQFAWVSLDAADGDPARFWNYVIGALQAVRPDVGEGALAALPAAGAALNDTVVPLLVNDLAAARGRSGRRSPLPCPRLDAGGGWLIFGCPPAELAAHPAEAEEHHELYLMCDDIHATVEELTGKGVEFTGPVSDQGFGLVTALRLPGGGDLGLYEPMHPTALSLND